MRLRKPFLLLGAGLFLWLAGSASVAASPYITPPGQTARRSAPDSNGAELTFRRVFKSSTPEFIEIIVNEGSDTASYEIRQLDDDPGAISFAVGAPLRAKMFALAGQLNHFLGQDLDVHRKIASLGEKTFRWHQGAVSYETKFNYTLNPAATQLLQIFEGLARQQENFELLSRRLKYDRLGINDALLECDSDYTRGLLPEPQTLLPLLDQIAGDSHLVDIARQRARSLGDRIRHPK
jgi:hypothetical protein